jgi:hypothetical protein
MILSPEASRFVAYAMLGASADDRDIWAAVDKDTRVLSPAAMVATLNGLAQYAQRLRATLDLPGISEREAASLSDDLGTVSAIENELRREIALDAPGAVKKADGPRWKMALSLSRISVNPSAT